MQLNKYSSADIAKWKVTNIVLLHVSIKNNIATCTPIKYSFFMSNGWNERLDSVTEMIQNTLKRHKINDLEILVNVLDYPINNPYFLHFSKTTECNVNTIPNFSFYKWTEAKSSNFMNTKEELINNNINWNDKLNKIFWAGSNLSPIRSTLNKFANHDMYEYNLLDYGGKFVKLVDHCKYKYLLDMEGLGYSGRVPYLFLTGSCVIILENEHPNRDYKLYYDNDFIENIHYLKVKFNNNDSADIIHDKIMNKINTSDCEMIGKKGKELAVTYYTYENIENYMAKLLNYYSELYEVSDKLYNPDIVYKRNLNKIK